MATSSLAGSAEDFAAGKYRIVDVTEEEEVLYGGVLEIDLLLADGSREGSEKWRGPFRIRGGAGSRS
ncbi:hypothetical protein [Candidatus Methanocrinis natronophilus]|uniref:Uncharacterized protein n=1 Tax=Candidatus Methanocrinis natronophilus TaxID=3033396 RepID=A0ABT5X8A1_9EURY|nr:hypothetical protein [Candidatus Methanocrinis natronophilus]MDF0590929.1 hypothetical protein [Candidatus Methanocrinis natronophilus]